MAKGLVTGTHLTNIANAIRTKLGVQTTYQPSQMAAAIESIPTGGSNVLDLSTGIRFGYSQFTQLPDEIANADWSAVTSMKGIFSHCSNLTTIPLLDTSNVKDMYEAFDACSKLVSISLIDTSNVTNMMYAFYSCRSLQALPALNTSMVTNMQSMFNGCFNLTTIPLLNTSKITTSGLVSTFYNCSALSNASLNNILAMCANATLITDASYKTLKRVGLTSAQALICEDLSNWSDFLAAGWTSGY